MFNKLFRYPRVISRHANAPLAKERITFLSHLALRGTPDSTLLRYATELRVISIMLGNQIPGPITPQAISQCAQRRARRQRRQGRAQSLKWPREHFRQVASAWCLFMGWLKDKPAPPLAYAAQLQVWAAFCDPKHIWPKALFRVTAGGFGFSCNGFTGKSCRCAD